MNASVIARIAKIIPLAVVAAVGVAACGPANGGASVAASAPVTTPAATSLATPGAGAVPTPVTPVDTAPTTAPAAAPTAAEVVDGSAAVETAKPVPAQPVPAKTAAKAAAQPTPAKPAPAKPTDRPGGSGGGVGISFSGLSEGGRIELDDLVSFSVTWKNNDATGTRSVAPVVATQQYEGAPCGTAVAMAEGTLERKDASGWKTLDHLSQGSGMDYVMNRSDGAFTLTAGESRTIEYRMRLSPANRPGRIAIEADAPVPNSANYQGMAKAVVHAAVVDHHSPEVVSVMPPAKGAIGTDPMSFSYRVSSPDGTAGLRPLVSVSSPGLLSAKDFTVEARVGTEWKPVEVREDCDGLAVVTAGLSGVRDGGTVEYAFRITFKETPQHLVDFRVGAESNGHRSAMRSVFGRDGL